jgi:hypothetical protein
MKLEDLVCVNQNIDLDKYIEFREEVKRHMEHPEWLGNFTKEELEDLLKRDSKLWVYYYNNIPICSMMLIPAREKDINKFGLSIDYKKTMDYGPMFVNYDYLGNNLQLQMLKEEDKYSKSKGYLYAVSTIHPDNIYSIVNFLKDDFKLVDTKEFKRGIRNIYYKELR